MRIYIENNLIYGFNRQKTFKPKYMIKNIRLSPRHKAYNENSMGGEGLLLAKGKWNKNLLVVFFGKEAKHISLFIFCYVTIGLLN